MSPFLKRSLFVLALVAFAATLSGCLGMFYGMRTRAILAREKDLPRDPETGLLKGAAPFCLPGADNKKAALLIHGFADTPYDVRPVGEYLAQRGIASCAPLLTGHGTSVREMAKTAWPDWMEEPERALAEMKDNYDEVYLVGFSMGANIAIHLAAKYDVAGVVMLAPSMFTIGQDRPVTTERALKDLTPFVMTDYIINNEEDAAFDMSAVEGRAVYTLFPISSLRSLVEFMETTREELPKVDEPVLVIQSVNDDTVDASGPDYVMDNVASGEKEVFWVERSKHLLTLDLEKDRVNSKLYEFLVKPR